MLATMEKTMDVTNPRYYKDIEREFRELGSQFRESIAFRWAQLCKELMANAEFCAQFEDKAEVAMRHIDDNFLCDSVIKCEGFLQLLHRFPGREMWERKKLTDLLIIYENEVKEKAKQRRAEERKQEAPPQIEPVMPAAVVSRPVSPETPTQSESIPQPPAAKKEKRRINKATLELLDSGKIMLQKMKKDGIDTMDKELVELLNAVVKQANILLGKK